MRLLVTFAVALIACIPVAQANGTAPLDRGLDGFVTIDRLPIPDHPALKAGRLIWAENCENCHGGNKATGAPKITSKRAWAPRMDQGMDVLIDHAINGFVGPKYTQMPARGANPDLTDDQVALAVAFMVWASLGAAPVQDFLTSTKGMGQ